MQQPGLIFLDRPSPREKVERESCSEQGWSKFHLRNSHDGGAGPLHASRRDEGIPDLWMEEVLFPRLRLSHRLCLSNGSASSTEAKPRRDEHSPDAGKRA